MRTRMRENVPALAAGSLAILLVGWVGLTDWQWNDYDREARPGFDALLGGHLLHFLQLAPAYGGSLVLRAPFVLIPKLWGGGELSTYRAAAAPCLFASVVLGVWLVARMRSIGRTAAAKAAALILCVANPATVSALEAGHPEELLGAVLCVAAVLVAIRGRPIWAGLLLGLAVANKDWALLAVGPVLIALPEGRTQAMLAAAAVAAMVLGPLVATGGLVHQASGAATATGAIFTPLQVWWFLGSGTREVVAGHSFAIRTAPAWLGGIAHPLIVLVAIPLTVLCWWLRRRGTVRPHNEALLLLLLLLLLRCMLDPWDNSYYPLPFLIALLAWDVLTLERAPLLAFTGSFAAWFVFQWAVPAHGVWANGQAAIFLAITGPALLAIAAALYAPGVGRRLTIGPRPDAGVPSPAYPVA